MKNKISLKTKISCTTLVILMLLSIFLITDACFGIYFMKGISLQEKMGIHHVSAFLVMTPVISICIVSYLFIDAIYKKIGKI